MELVDNALEKLEVKRDQLPEELGTRYDDLASRVDSYNNSVDEYNATAEEERTQDIFDALEKEGNAIDQEETNLAEAITEWGNKAKASKPAPSSAPSKKATATPKASATQPAANAGTEPSNEPANNASSAQTAAAAQATVNTDDNPPQKEGDGSGILMVVGGLLVGALVLVATGGRFNMFNRS
jgi:hypothetical protein